MPALVATVALALTGAVMRRDPACGFCEKWVAQVRKAVGRSVRIVDDANRPELQGKIGLPASFASCHTALIDGMAFEDYVCIADTNRVLAAKPKGVRSLAVARMPIGSAGMEGPGAKPEQCAVVAFGIGKPFVYARH